MAYQIQRKKTVDETLELLDANGNVGCKVRVSLDADSIASEFTVRYRAVAEAQQKLKQYQEQVKNADEDEAIEGVAESMELLGEAVISIFQLIFGNDGAQQIVKFYESRYLEMCLDIFPFINNVVQPAIEKRLQDQHSQLVSKYAPAKKSIFRR
jgi:hypothetical protein